MRERQPSSMVFVDDSTGEAEPESPSTLLRAVSGAEDVSEVASFDALSGIAYLDHY
jgi:hypothetical protein